MKKIILLSVLLFMLVLNCMCSKQTVRPSDNIEAFPPVNGDTIKFWKKLKESNEDIYYVLYKGSHLNQELTIKKTDLNGVDLYTSVIDTLCEGKWCLTESTYGSAISSTMMSFSIYNRGQNESSDSLGVIAYTVKGNTGELLNETPEFLTDDYPVTFFSIELYCCTEDSYIFVCELCCNSTTKGYLFHVNIDGTDKWVRGMTDSEFGFFDEPIGFNKYSKNFVVVNGKLVYDVVSYRSHELHLLDIKSATEELCCNSLSLRDDEVPGIFYKLESADLTETMFIVTYDKYSKCPIVEKEYDSILGEYVEKITGYKDVLQGKIVYDISYPDGKLIRKQELNLES